MAAASPLRIVVTGLAATFPYGGVFWDYIQYVLGFLDLGHDVLYLEDTGKWCYDPHAQTFVEDGERNAFHLQRQLAALDDRLTDRWFYRDATERTYGRAWPEVVDFCRQADLFLHVSASCWMREEYFAAACTAFIDSDPMYTQAAIPVVQAATADDVSRQRVEMLREHDFFFTFGENIGGHDCLVPAAMIDWIPTRQPIVTRCFEAHRVPWHARRRVLTTIASWEPAESGPVVDGVRYVGKSREFERFLTLARRSPVPLELAVSGELPRNRLREYGWVVREGLEVSADPWIYRRYLADSLGEWSVAKHAYVASRSGWFSCRTACYLALGVPAIVQDTGFAIPVGEGLLAFDHEDQAIAAIEDLVADPDHHSRRAIELANEYFDSAKVLTQLLDHLTCATPSSARRAP